MSLATVEDLGKLRAFVNAADLSGQRNSPPFSLRGCNLCCGISPQVSVISGVFIVIMCPVKEAGKDPNTAF